MTGKYRRRAIIFVVLGLATVTCGTASLYALRYMGLQPNEAKTQVLSIVDSIGGGVTVAGDPICADGSARSDFDSIDPWYIAAFVVGPAEADIDRSVIDAAQRHGWTLTPDNAWVDMLKRHADPTTLEHIDSPKTYDPTTRYLSATLANGHRLRVEIHTREGVGLPPCKEVRQPPAGKAIILVNLSLWDS